jgi:hypothetical protein
MNYGSKQAQEGHFRNDFPMNWGFGGIEFGFLGMSFWVGMVLSQGKIRFKPSASSEILLLHSKILHSYDR